MHYNATLCKEALEKKLLAQVAKHTCFCFKRWASSLADGFIISDESTIVFNHQAKCLICVGTKTVTVIFLKRWEGVAIGM